ncbi:MAG: hypothetical protein PHE51_07645 [Eubacteriales bacterium]|nr:hypothetical protein [Eubacteriales bacterium]
MYRQEADGSITQNAKGLIKINEDMSVKSIKPAYYTLQNIASVFDNTLNPIAGYDYTTSETSRLLHTTAYEKTGTGKQVIATWFKDDTPTNSTVTSPITYTVSKGNFDNPVYVDLRTGDVYNIRKWEKNGDSYTFYYIPVYDSAVLIADASAFEIDYIEDSVSALNVTDENGNTITALDTISSVVGSANIKIEDNEDVYMHIALYGDNNTLISVSSAKNDGDFISAKLILDDNSRRAKTIKAFIWHKDSMIPMLKQIVSINIK